MNSQFRKRVAIPILVALATAACATRSPAPITPAAPEDYEVYVANEASDIVSRLTFTPGGSLAVAGQIAVGEPGRISGPHGLAVSPDAGTWYVALSHSGTAGRVRRYSADGDSLRDAVGVGLFPATMAITPDGQYLFVTNSDLHGAALVSGVSVIYTSTMTEVARPNTCVRPRGGRLNVTATKHYSVCEGGDQLVEIDTRSFAVTRRFALTPGREQTIGADVRTGRTDAAASGCAPAWAEPGRGSRARFLYVACSARNEVIEIDTDGWRVARRFAAVAPLTLAIDPTGAILLVAQPSMQEVLIIDLALGVEHGRIRTSQAQPRGIAVTADGLFAFVTSERTGAARGTVDVIDLTLLQRSAVAEVAFSPGAVIVRSR